MNNLIRVALRYTDVTDRILVDDESTADALRQKGYDASSEPEGLYGVVATTDHGRISPSEFLEPDGVLIVGGASSETEEVLRTGMRVYVIGEGNDRILVCMRMVEDENINEGNLPDKPKFDVGDKVVLLSGTENIMGTVDVVVEKNPDSVYSVQPMCICTMEDGLISVREWTGRRTITAYEKMIRLSDEVIRHWIDLAEKADRAGVRDREDHVSTLVTSPVFRDFAPKDLKDKYPEAGADFGFFDAKRTHEGIIDWFRTKRDLVAVPHAAGVSWIDFNVPKVCQPTQKEIDEYLRKEIEKDPTYVKSEVFLKCASPELRREHPETGTDFGFFDAKKVDEGILDWRKIEKHRYERNDRIYWPKMNFSGVVKDYSYDHRWIYDVHVDYDDGLGIPKDEDYFLIESDIEPVEDYVRRKVEEDPSFASNPLFKYAPRDLKDKHPEAGTDFGFFDAKSNEAKSSEPKFSLGDFVTWEKYVSPVTFGILQHHTGRLFGRIIDRPRPRFVKDGVFVMGKYLVSYVSVDEMGELEPFQRTDTVEEKRLSAGVPYIEGMIAKDPSYVTTPEFRMYAPRDLKDKYPEAGIDFGFFDAVKESKDPGKFEVDDVVVFWNWGEAYIGRLKERDSKGFVTIDCDAHSGRPWNYVIHFRGDEGHGFRRREHDMMDVGEWMEEMIAEDSEFPKSKFFQEFAPRDLKDKYPEAGTDFGFFDAKKVNEAVNWAQWTSKHGEYELRSAWKGKEYRVEAVDPNGRTVGFATVEPPSGSYVNRPGYEFAVVYVEREYRRKGIAAAMVHHAEAALGERPRFGDDGIRPVA